MADGARYDFPIPDAAMIGRTTLLNGLRRVTVSQYLGVPATSSMWLVSQFDPILEAVPPA